MKQQLVVKCVNVSHDIKGPWAMNEIRKNELLDTLRCNHLLKYRGHGMRSTAKRTTPWYDRNPDEQHILHLYTDFAQYGDLLRVYEMHAKAEE
jgi:hypothetical protein